MKKLQQKLMLWLGWLKTKEIAEKFEYTRRYTLTLLTKAEEKGFVLRMKAFRVDDYKIVDIWKVSERGWKNVPKENTIK